MKKTYFRNTIFSTKYICPIFHNNYQLRRLARTDEQVNIFFKIAHCTQKKLIYEIQNYCLDYCVLLKIIYKNTTFVASQLIVIGFNLWLFYCIINFDINLLSPQLQYQASFSYEFVANNVQLPQLPHYKLMCCVLRYVFSIQHDGICTPSGRVWHKAFFKVGPGAGLEPTRARHFQKCVGPRRHSSKRGASCAGR